MARSRGGLNAALPAQGTHRWRVAGILVAWRRRRAYRRELRRLLRVGPHIIADIGLTVAQARDEADKPVWRP